MSAYIGEDGVEGTPVAKSTPEAVKLMMENRKYSAKINYDKFEELYTPSSSSVSRGGSESVQGGSPGGMLLGPSSSRPTRTVDDIESGGREERNEQRNTLEDEQVKELESIAGELDEEIEETEDDEDDGDPYGGMGYDSD